MQQPRRDVNEQTPPCEVAPAPAPATVRAVGPGNRVWLEEGGIQATVAVPAPYVPRAGDSVLVATGRAGERYVVGVLVALREAEQPPLVLRDGSSASVSTGPEGEVLRVSDSAGRLIFEHHAGAGRSVVHAPAGNLELRADEGGILLSARDTVRVHSTREVRLESEHSVRLGTTPTVERPASSLVLDARGTHLSTPDLQARAGHTRVTVDEASLVGRAVSVACETLHNRVDLLQTEASRIVERAENTYREVKELAQTRAGRLRLFAETTLHAFGRRTLLKAREDLKLKADKIHLA